VVAIAIGAGVAAYGGQWWRSIPVGSRQNARTHEALGRPGEGATGAAASASGGVETDGIAASLQAFALAHVGARATTAVVRAVLASQDAHVVPLELTSGQCIEVVAAGGAGVREVDLELADAAGQRVVDEDQHSVVENIRYCAPSGGSYRLTVRAVGGGPIGVQVFEVR
jgi:hypothetical protein